MTQRHETAMRSIEANVAVQDGLLKFPHVSADAADGGQEAARDGGVGGGQVGERHADRLRRQMGLVDPSRVIEHGGQAALADLAADALDDLGGRQWLAEDFDGRSAARLAHHAAARAEPIAKRGNRQPRIIASRVDEKHLQGSWRHMRLANSG
jgi:hypothetical protein